LKINPIDINHCQIAEKMLKLSQTLPPLTLTDAK